jgi:Flp pilus assembly pilin Flp
MLQTVTSTLKRILQDRRGISAMEYTVLAVGIVAAVAVAATALGTDIGVALGKVGNYMSAVSMPAA